MSTLGLPGWSGLALLIGFAFSSVAYAEPLSQRAPAAIFPDFAVLQRQSLTAFPLLPPRLAVYTPHSLASSECNRPLFTSSQLASADSLKTQDSSGQIGVPPKSPVAEHHFWDRENDLLFAAVGASRALDYSSTLNFRRRGRDEVFLTNDIVDNHAAFAAIEAGGVAVSIGVAYVFHHYHHHSLERWTSIVHASLATGGAIRNYSLKTAH
jgi:hypothetical protein